MLEDRTWSLRSHIRHIPGSDRGNCNLHVCRFVSPRKSNLSTNFVQHRSWSSDVSNGVPVRRTSIHPGPCTLTRYLTAPPPMRCAIDLKTVSRGSRLVGHAISWWPSRHRLWSAMAIARSARGFAAGTRLVGCCEVVRLLWLWLFCCGCGRKKMFPPNPSGSGESGLGVR